MKKHPFKSQIEIPLKHPVAGLTILTMRRPQTLDLIVSEQASDNATEQAAILSANLCEISPDAFDEIDLDDYAAVNAAFVELTAFEPVKNYQAGQPIPLGVPIKVGETEVSTIALRRPKVRDHRESMRHQGGDKEKDLVFFSGLSGVAFEALKALDYADFRKIKAASADFFA